MSTYPYSNLEARVSALERRQLHTDAHIEELSHDMAPRIKEVADNLQSGFNHLAKYQISTEQQIETRFNRIEQRLDNVEKVLSDHTVRLDNVEKILSDHTVRLDNVEKILSDHTVRLDRMETLLIQILARLPEKP